MAELAAVFAIDVCTSAVTSNHYHLVVRLDVEKARELAEDEVIARYGRLFKMPVLIERYLDGLTTEAEDIVAQKILGQWRERLCDLSWYMRGLNEYLARRANAEDGCKGRFWTAPAHPCARGIRSSLTIEGRYKSQALLDDTAVLTCMSYVDLNPFRAKMAETPEESDFTSIQARQLLLRCSSGIHAVERIRSLKPISVASPKGAEPPQPAETTATHPSSKPAKTITYTGVGYTECDYFELVDWAGRTVRSDKRGAIPRHIPPILSRLGLDPGCYLRPMSGMSKLSHHLTAIGPLDRLQALAKKMGQAFLKGNGLASSCTAPACDSRMMPVR